MRHDILLSILYKQSMIFRLSSVLRFVAISAAVGCSGSTTTYVSDSPPGSTVDGTTPGEDGGTSEGGKGQGGGSDGGDPKPEPIVPTSGCGATKGPTGAQTMTAKVAGGDRAYQLVVPEGYDGKRPLSLTFVFHGLGGNAAQIRSYLNMESFAAGNSLFVYPEGVPQSAAGGRTAWDVSDLAFFDVMVADISKSYCVDSKRIFAAGHSYGGFMTNAVGCGRGEVVRAIAPVSGGLSPTACKTPVAAWIAHGDKDRTVPQTQGIAARDQWLKLNQCSTSTTPVPPDQCVSYDGCSAGHPVVWCSFSGAHFPPSFTSQGIWDFFASM